MTIIKTKKRIKKSNDILATLSRFICILTHHALLVYKLLMKEEAFEWIPERNTFITKLKEVSSQPPILV